MSIQIPVVVSQSHKSNSTRRQLEEDLVARLMLEESADVRLVGALENINSDSTDLLMLEGIGNSFALICWTSPEQALTNLTSVNITGRRAGHRLDPTPPVTTGRPVYFIQLSDTTSLDSVVSLLGECSRDQKTKAVQIGLGSPQDAAPTSVQQVTKPSGTSTSAPNLIQPASAVAAADELSRSQELELDSLVDDLDELDL